MDKVPCYAAYSYGWTRAKSVTHARQHRQFDGRLVWSSPVCIGGANCPYPRRHGHLTAFLLKPVVELFQWTGLGRTLSVILVVVVIGIVFVGLGWVVTAQVTRLAYDLGHNLQ